MRTPWKVLGGGLALTGLAALSATSGCEQVADFYSCTDPIKDSPDPCPEPRPDAGAAAADAAVEDCSGQCVPRTELGWFEPSLLWYGPPGEQPPCPDAAPFLGYQGHADLGQLALACPTCGCDPPDATCTLPTDWAAHSAFTCDAAGAQTLPFAAPAGWDGACTTMNAIPAGQSCGGVPCVQSLSIPAPPLPPAHAPRSSRSRPPPPTSPGPGPPPSWPAPGRRTPRAPTPAPRAPPSRRRRTPRPRRLPHLHLPRGGPGVPGRLPGQARLLRRCRRPAQLHPLRLRGCDRSVMHDHGLRLHRQRLHGTPQHQRGQLLRPALRQPPARLRPGEQVSDPHHAQPGHLPAERRRLGGRHRAERAVNVLLPALN